MVNDVLDQPITGRFADGAHRLPVRVYYEDTDAGGVVYHASYLRFMERGRTEMLRLAGIGQSEAIADGTGFYVVAAMAIRFRRPARLDDMLSIESRIADIRGSSCLIQQRVMRGGDIVTDADVTVAFVGLDGRPKRQPAAWIEAFGPVQGKKGTT